MAVTQIGNALGLPGLLLYDHPMPHPPTAAVLLSPLAWLPYAPAAVAWRAIAVVALLPLAWALTRLANIRLPLLALVLASLCLILFGPVRDDLLWGNMSTIGAALLAVSVLALRTQRPRWAGLLLALDLLLKPIMWPVLPFLLLRRQWAALSTALATGGFISGLTVALIGPPAAFRYLTQSLPLATSDYQSDWFNISLLSLPQRLCVQTSPVKLK